MKDRHSMPLPFIVRLALAILVTALVSPAQSVQPTLATATEYEIADFVGTPGGLGSADGIRSAARFYAPAGIWGDGTNVYVADGGNHTIRKIVLSTGQVTTLAGAAGPAGSVDAVGTDARFDILEGMWGDGTHLYVSDLGNRTIRKVEIASGTVTTVAGASGVQGLTDGAGSAARFIGPGAIWGNGTDLYVADISNAARVIRRITIATGQVTTIANLTAVANASSLLGLWGDSTNLWVADAAAHSIRKVVIATGEVTTFAGSNLDAGDADGPAIVARFFGPAGIWGDGTNLFVADSFNGTIRRVSMTTGDTTTIAGLPGEVGADDGTGPAARFNIPFAMWGAGTDLYVADYSNNTIRRILTTTTAVSTLAGLAPSAGIADGTGAAAQFAAPTMVWSDGTNLYIVDSAAMTIRKANATTREVTTIAGTPGTRDSVDGTGASAHFVSPVGITGDANNLYVTEAAADTVRKIQVATSQVTTLAGDAIAPSGSTDGIGIAARFTAPLGIWGDGTHLYLADRGNYTIRRIVIASGEVTTFAGAARIQGLTNGIGSAARFVYPQAVWGDGTSLYVADGHAIRKITIANAEVTTIAGNLIQPGTGDGSGTAASFNFPVGLWGDGTNLYVADSENTTIRKIDLRTNTVTTIIGKALTPGTENGRAAAGRLVYPIGLWGDGNYLYVTDNGGHNVRRISAAGSAATENTLLRFSLTNRGGVSATTIGSGASFTVGYGRIQPNPDSTTPSGMAIFGLTQGGVLVSEAAVPAAPLIQSARIYAEINGPVNTGLAIANPNLQSASISFYFTDAAGVNSNLGTTTIPPNRQIAAFLNQSPFSTPGAFQGNLADVRTFTITSSVPISLVALRGFTNERSETLITTLPVTPVNATLPAPLIFPHFADGAGWRTQLILVNPSNETLTGNVQFNGQDSSSTTSSYTISPRSSFTVSTSGTGTSVRVGWIRVTPAAGSQAPSGLGVFSFRNGGVLVTEAGVPALPVASAFRLYVEASGNFTAAEIGSVQTGFAIANSASNPVTVNFELTALDGSPTGLSGSTTIPGNGQTAMFLNQVEGLRNLPLPFRGVLRISGSGISVVGLRGRYNQRGDFLMTTMSPVDEAAATTSAEFVFPHLVDGGGYTTQFVLFSGGAGQSSAGTVRFYDQSGQALPLPTSPPLRGGENAGIQLRRNPYSSVKN
jgi:hypothetical protein